MAHRERTSSSFRTQSDAIAKSWRLGFTFLLLAQLFGSSLTIRWLALSRVSSLGVSHSPASVCDELSSSLVTKQVQFCKKHPGFMSSVQNGAAAAIDECKFQFRSRRWNCSTLDELPTVVSLQQPTALPQKSKATSPSTSKKKPKTVVSRDVNAGNSSVGFVAEAQIPERKPTAPNVNAFSPYPVVPAGTRESAFVHAISAAGVAHSLTRACSSGELEDCGCDRTVRGVSPEGFQWAGCSDNVHFGTSFSRTFVDAREHRATKKSAGKNGKNAEAVWRALMNLHNNEAGRKVVEKSMRIECKCHGVSGSCELRTCWKAMPSFREIGELLKEKFDGATEVEVRTWHSGSRRQLVPRSPTYKPHTDADLVYLDRSPDYCEYDAAIGSLGTHGRPCNKTSKAIDGCDLLCCNRGYRSHRERRSERCMCKFHWCCSVQCKTCVRDVEVHTCL